MLNTKEHFKQIEMDTIQHEPLFTELTPEAAAAIEGSGSFRENVRFDAFDSTQRFNVAPGGNITLFSNTRNIPSGANNPTFTAAIRNIRTNNTNTKTVSVGRDTTQWTGVRGGTYEIIFRDTRDRVFVSGSVGVAYT